jgi:ABC-type branched-subunit amino acid transport system ATPase component
MPISGEQRDGSRDVLAVTQLTAGYSSVPVLHDVSVAVAAAELVVVIGPNGSGKSTLLKAIMGLIRVESGRVILEGKELIGMAPYLVARSGIGYVPQSRSVFPSLTVIENLETAGLAAGRKERVARIQKVLDGFPDLRSAVRKRAGTLSGGQRNLLGVARAMMLEPKALLVDEPTAGLSPVNARSVWSQLEMVADNGTAVIVVEQSVTGALEHAHRCFVLVNGRNRLSGSASEVRDLDLASVFLGGPTGASSTVPEAK